MENSSCAMKCLKFKVPKMPKIKDFNRCYQFNKSYAHVRKKSSYES